MHVETADQVLVRIGIHVCVRHGIIRNPLPHSIVVEHKVGISLKNQLVLLIWRLQVLTWEHEVTRRKDRASVLSERKNLKFKSHIIHL